MNAEMPMPLSHAAMSVPSVPTFRVLFPPPAATMIPAPVAFPAGARCSSIEGLLMLTMLWTRSGWPLVQLKTSGSSRCLSVVESGGHSVTTVAPGTMGSGFAGPAGDCASAAMEAKRNGRTRRTSGMFRIRTNGDDEVVRRDRAGVPQAMEFARSRISDTTGAEMLGLALQDEFERTFANQHQFRMHVPMGRVRHLAE